MTENVESLKLSWPGKEITFTSEEAPVLRFLVNGKIQLIAMSVDRLYKQLKKANPGFGEIHPRDNPQNNDRK